MIDRQGIRTFAALLAPSIAYIVLLSVVVMRDDIDWGDAPSWVGAIVTSGALLIAALAYRKDRSRAALAEDRQRLAEERLARAQASQFATWVDGRAFQLSNNSSEPIYEVEAFTTRFNDGSGIGGSTGSTGSSQIDRWDVVPPGSVRKSTVPRLEDASPFGVRVSFTDNAGVRWVRDGGELRRHDAP